MSAHLQADAAHPVASASRPSDNDALYRRIGVRIVPFLFICFSGAGAAGGIALISSIGVSSGMITPWIVGVIRTRTGSMDSAMLMIAALLAACAVAMLLGVRATSRDAALASR
ncbi:hypothetical protein [Burkholderia sp. Bp9012]|uniref:hypothetical protein n=1 Tax=Burkholderia sp. Bp9012 TaxID=2184562 RepID=UPI0026B924D4|nr:hypothetical protein [Burkholderia sp. Bp9012]